VAGDFGVADLYRHMELSCFFDENTENKSIHLMKIANQLSIAWIQKEGRVRDQFVVVHSRPITPSDAEEAWQKTKDGKVIDGFIPIVFLDKQLDSSDLRSWLDKQAIRRRNLI
jgi:hypothetical protein